MNNNGENNGENNMLAGVRIQWPTAAIVCIVVLIWLMLQQFACTCYGDCGAPVCFTHPVAVSCSEIDAYSTRTVAHQPWGESSYVQSHTNDQRMCPARQSPTQATCPAAGPPAIDCNSPAQLGVQGIQEAAGGGSSDCHVICCAWCCSLVCPEVHDATDMRMRVSAVCSKCISSVLPSLSSSSSSSSLQPIHLKAMHEQCMKQYMHISQGKPAANSYGYYCPSVSSDPLCLEDKTTCWSAASLMATTVRQPLCQLPHTSHPLSTPECSCLLMMCYVQCGDYQTYQWFPFYSWTCNMAPTTQKEVKGLLDCDSHLDLGTCPAPTLYVNKRNDAKCFTRYDNYTTMTTHPTATYENKTEKSKSMTESGDCTTSESCAAAAKSCPARQLYKSETKRDICAMRSRNDTYDMKRADQNSSSNVKYVYETRAGMLFPGCSNLPFYQNARSSLTCKASEKSDRNTSIVIFPVVEQTESKEELDKLPSSCNDSMCTSFPSASLHGKNWKSPTSFESSDEYTSLESCPASVLYKRDSNTCKLSAKSGKNISIGSCSAVDLFKRESNTCELPAKSGKNTAIGSCPATALYKRESNTCKLPAKASKDTAVGSCPAIALYKRESNTCKASVTSAVSKDQMDKHCLREKRNTLATASFVADHKWDASSARCIEDTQCCICPATTLYESIDTDDYLMHGSNKHTHSYSSLAVLHHRDEKICLPRSNDTLIVLHEHIADNGTCLAQYSSDMNLDGDAKSSAMLKSSGDNRKCFLHHQNVHFEQSELYKFYNLTGICLALNDKNMGMIPFESNKDDGICLLQLDVTKTDREQPSSVVYETRGDAGVCVAGYNGQYTALYESNQEQDMCLPRTKENIDLDNLSIMPYASHVDENREGGSNKNNSTEYVLYEWKKEIWPMCYSPSD